MSRAIKIDGVLYVPAVEAGKSFGYSNDYISRLAREGKVLGRRVGKQWFVAPESVADFVTHSEAEKAERAEQLRTLRKQERVVAQVVRTPLVATTHLEVDDQPAHRLRAILQAGCVVGAGTMLGSLLFLLSSGVAFPGAAQVQALFDARTLAYTLYHNEDVAENLSANAIAASADVSAGDESAEGIVIYDEDAESAEAITTYFSDEVTVARDSDGKSGVIRPVFKNQHDEEYRFLMVPIESP